MHSGPLDAALATIARDSEIGGPILAGAVAYRLFVFALPLGFFLVSGLGVLALAWERSAAAVTVGGRSLGVLSAAIVGQLVLVAGVGAVREQTPAGGVAVFVFLQTREVLPQRGRDPRPPPRRD